MDGLLPLQWNEKDGKLLLEIPRLNQELIYQVSLASGVGSNPIGLDRGQMGPTYLVRFERVGPKVLMVQPNLRFRALNGSPGEQRAVEESFATSILWSFPIESENAGLIVVDATEFFLRDAHGVARRLRDANQGNYSVDARRSAIYLPRTKAFPKNTEVEATITLTTSDRPGRLVASVTPTAEVVTVRQHHSFVELPPPGYEPRPFDPRAGFFGIEIYDYASPFSEPLEKRFIARHRLSRDKPIIYYVDHGVPEPIRSALVDGASWWNAAFEKIGLPNGFQVRILPEDADPMDIRYNVINWVHRSTRGWSYGAAVIDPRTGEILKGNVSLGSLRIRQDVLLGTGMIPPYEGPNPEVLATLDKSTSPTELALARIRQLSAHEVGHTLGIAHNMAASTYDRASVMDYPAPLITIRDGKLDFSEAYGRGAFDEFAIRYGYSEPMVIPKEWPLFVSDAHSRDAGAAHPLGSVWDNGSDPIAMLRHEMEVRRIALESFGLGNLRPGAPLSELEPILLPLYLHHRYQLEAAVKSLGGAMFTYAVREGTEVVPQPVREIVPPARQREALRAALDTIEPSFLAIPQRILDLIPPTALEGGTAERFDRATAPLFDPIAAARSAAAITLNALLHPARAARLVRFHEENRANPSLAEVTQSLIDAVSRDLGAVQGAVRSVAVAKLIEVAGDPEVDVAVRAQYEQALADLAARLRARPSTRGEAATIQRFLDRTATPVPNPVLPAIPPGPPI